MNENQQSLKEAHKKDYYEDEIELIDILRVIWKWKYFILTGAIACGLIAAIISFNRPKIYSIDMVLKPGILSIGNQGKSVYIDSAENIMELITSGTFNGDILNYLSEIKMRDIPKKLEFKGTILKHSNTIKVEYETDDIKQGIVILNHLSELLKKEYSKLVQHFKGEYDVKLSLIKHKNDNIDATIQSYKRNIKNIEKRNNELVAEVKLIKNNSRNLVAEKNELYSNIPKEIDGFQSLIHAYLIQQNLELTHNTLNEIYDYKLKKEAQFQKILSLTNQKESNLNDMKMLQFEKDNVQNIQILQPPTSSLHPVKPKTKLNVIVSLLAGFFVMLFLTFFLEYLGKYRKRQVADGN